MRGSKSLVFFAAMAGSCSMLVAQNVPAQVGINILALPRQIEICGNIAVAADEFSLVPEQILEALLFAHYQLRFLGIRPEVRIGGLSIDLG